MLPTDPRRFIRPLLGATLLLSSIAGPWFHPRSAAQQEPPDVAVAVPLDDPAAAGRAAQRMLELEGVLASHLPGSDQAAAAMLELLQLYAQQGQAFGVVRVARRFIAAHPQHEWHPAVMRLLLDALRANASHVELQATARQYAERYPEGEHIGDVWRIMAESLVATEAPAGATAEAWQNAWLARGSEAGLDEGVQAIRWHLERNHAEGFAAAAAVADRMVAELPASAASAAAEIGWQGVQAARRASQWQVAADLGDKLAGSAAIVAAMSTDRRHELHTALGESHANLGGHEAAVGHYSTAVSLAPGDRDSHHRRLNAHASGGHDARGFAEALRDYRSRFADSEEAPVFAFRLARVLAEAGNRDAAMRTAAAAFTERVASEDDVRAYLGWATADEADGTDAVPPLLEAARANPRDAWRIHWVLAFDFYRDRHEDHNRAAQQVRLMLHRAPSNQSGFSGAVTWLLGHLEDEAGFREEVGRLLETAAANPHMHNYGALLGEWIGSAEREDATRERAAWAKPRHEALASQDHIRWWARARDDNDAAREARSSLLERTDLSREQREMLLRWQSRDHRDRLPTNQRHLSVPVFADLAALLPNDYGAARDWLDAAMNYGEREQREQAADHLLKLEPPHTDPGTELHLLQVVAPGEEEEPDQAAIARAHRWIAAARTAHGDVTESAAEIGDRLWSLGLEDEALAWWRRHAALDPDDSQTRACVSRLLDRIDGDDHAARVALLQPHLESPSDNHGTYAAWTADALLKSGDFDGFVRVLETARARQDLRPFRSWGFSDSPADQWLRAALDSENDWPAETRSRVLNAIAGMRAGRPSAAAMLEVVLDPETPRNLARLVSCHKATLLAGRHSLTWDWLRPRAQRAAANEDHAAAAAIYSGLLQNVGSGDNDQLEQARFELRQALTRLGGSGLEVAADSPLAPLMEIGLHLRLDDPAAAAETYQRHRELFDEHRADLPVEILAFAASTHIGAGGLDNHERAEDLLRSWIIAHSEEEDMPQEDKAQMQLLLARNYERAGRYEIARSEYTTVVNRYPDTSHADEARFGIGTTFMEQRIYDQAEDAFLALLDSPLPATRLRAQFLRGVLASRQGDTDQARSIFRSVLAATPDVDLADRTLFELAEIYGVEQRYLDQLQLLRTVGRLGRESKLWHVPGHALSLVVQDTDLGISRGRGRIPVTVRTVPGGDEEVVHLHAGGAGRGLFIGEIPTALGAAESGDGVLQVLGSDVITVEYPEDFRRQFAEVGGGGSEIRIASDADFAMASQRIEDPDEDAEAVPEAARVEEELDPLRAEQRPSDQIKPGNPIYFRLRDPDRSLTPEPDEISVMVEASSGDSVEVRLRETGPVTGVFRGELITDDLPAGAVASDSAIDHSPLMALDGNPSTSWRSEPDGVAPKSLEVDMKQLHEVRSIRLQSPGNREGRPLRFSVFGSHDGRYFPRIAAFPEPEAATPWPEAFERMHGRVLAVDDAALSGWDQLIERLEAEGWSGFEVESALRWPLETPDPEDEGMAGARLVVWQGLLHQPRAGAMRFQLLGHTVAAMVNDELVLPPRRVDEEPVSFDLLLEEGHHEVVFAVTLADPRQAAARVLRARENLNVAAVTPAPFQVEDFPAEADPELLALQPGTAVMTAEDTNWFITLPGRELRHLRFRFEEFDGPAVAVSQVQVNTQDGVVIPPDVDLLALATNDVLEIAPGDTVTGTYIDQFTADGSRRNRALIRTMTATYHNGTILPINYDFVREGDGTIRQIRKEIRRIDPGTRLIAEITDFDLDTTGQRDRVPVRVSVPGRGSLELMAVETDDSSGIFHAEFDTVPLGEPEPDALEVAPGDVVVMEYVDEHNTFPGHATRRESSVLVRQPSDAELRIVETLARRVPPPSDNGAAAGDDDEGSGPLVMSPAERERQPLQVTYLEPRSAAIEPGDAKAVAVEAPLTVEIMHPYAALDTSSHVIAEIQVGDRDPVQLRCVVSPAHAAEGRLPSAEEIRHPALEAGRFVGQVRLQLGSPGSPAHIPASEAIANGDMSVVGGPVRTEDEPRPDNTVPVLNLTGDEIIRVSYRIEAEHRPPVEVASVGGAEADAIAALQEGGLERRDFARAASDGAVAFTDGNYERAVDRIHLGERLHLHVHDPDRDISGGRDHISVVVRSNRGEEETVVLEEALSHGGHFTGSLGLRASEEPVAGNLDPDRPEIEAFFGDRLEVVYLDERPAGGGAAVERRHAINVALGTDGRVGAFSKRFHNEELAIQTQFHIAEAYFELFKGQLALDRRQEAMHDLELGRRTLAELQQDYPDPQYAPRVAYLLGQFSQELEDWPAAIAAYETVVRDHPDHILAADAQYKLGQCYEKSDRFDEALEAYVTLAATYPDSPLIASVMVRIIDRFYETEDYESAAGVGSKFLERFDSHQWAPRIAFRVGQSYYRDEQHARGGAAFDDFVRQFPDDELTAQALFWAGESYRMANNVPEAFRRYNRCRWDFPESDAAKYARGRLALPEMLAQFEREAQIEE